MNQMDNESVRQRLADWEKAAPVLGRLRIDAIRKSNTAVAIEQLIDAFESALRHYRPQKTSGLAPLCPVPYMKALFHIVAGTIGLGIYFRTSETTQRLMNYFV